MFGLPLRKGFSMKVEGAVNLNRPDMHNIAAELGVGTNDVLLKDGILTVYNTSDSCQEIVDDNALAVFVAMALDISPDNITALQEVEEEPVELDFDLSEFQDDD
jgi:hypothetical protein